MRIKGQENIAAVFGVAPKTIVEWQEQGFPIAFQGQRGIASEYESEACIEWLVKREVGKVQGAESPKDRLDRLRGDEAAMRIAEKNGQLVPVETIEPAWTEMVLSARNFLRAAHDRLAHLLEATPGVDAKRDLLAETFDEFLGKLAKHEPGDDADSGARSADRDDAPGARALRTAAEDDGGPVGGEVSPA